MLHKFRLAVFMLNLVMIVYHATRFVLSLFDGGSISTTLWYLLMTVLLVRVVASMINSSPKVDARARSKP